MCSLPKAIPGWPTFNASKRRKAADQNLFFQLVSSSHRLRFEATLDLLRKGDSVVSTGVAGIGKSTEINAYLMEFIANIGKEGWPKEVWYRYNHTYIYC